MEDSLRCDLCGTNDEERRTWKCPICFKRFCRECGVLVSGREFCSRYCGEYFFFGGDEED